MQLHCTLHWPPIKQRFDPDHPHLGYSSYYGSTQQSALLSIWKDTGAPSLNSLPKPTLNSYHGPKFTSHTVHSDYFFCGVCFGIFFNTFPTLFAIGQRSANPGSRAKFGCRSFPSGPHGGVNKNINANFLDCQCSSTSHIDVLNYC